MNLNLNLNLTDIASLSFIIRFRRSDEIILFNMNINMNI